MHLTNDTHILAASILAGAIIMATTRNKKNSIPSPKEVDYAIDLASTALHTVINKKRIPSSPAPRP